MLENLKLYDGQEGFNLDESVRRVEPSEKTMPMLSVMEKILSESLQSDNFISLNLWLMAHIGALYCKIGQTYSAQLYCRKCRTYFSYYWKKIVNTNKSSI